MKSNLGITVILFLITLTVYVLSFRGEGASWNYFVLLSDALMHGRLYFLSNPPWLNELVFWGGHYYTVFPIMPAVLLMPFVAIFGTSFLQPIASILIGSVNVALSYSVFQKVLHKKDLAIWMSVLFAFGTIHWYHTEVGSAWYFAQVTSLFFIWLFLLESFTKARLFVLGLLLSCSYLARLPTILGIFFVLIFFYERFFILEKRRFQIKFQNLFFLFCGLLPGLLINALYNYLRFNSIFDVGYEILLAKDPWHPYGVFSLKYVLPRIKEFFLAMPTLSSKPPYIIPSLYAMAFWLTTPAVVLAFFTKFKNKLVIACWVSILLIAIPSFAKGANGFTQFGFRYSLDYLPFLLIIMGLGVGNKIRWWAKFLIIISIAINFWGVLMISILNIWTM